MLEFGGFDTVLLARDPDKFSYFILVVICLPCNTVIGLQNRVDRKGDKTREWLENIIRHDGNAELSLYHWESVLG